MKMDTPHQEVSIFILWLSMLKICDKIPHITGLNQKENTCLNSVESALFEHVGTQEDEDRASKERDHIDRCDAVE